MSNAMCTDLMRARALVDWEKLLQYLSGDFRQFAYEASNPSLSVTYVRRNLTINESQPPLTASLDRAAELVAVMPENARKMLLAPIRYGLLDLQSVFYLKDIERDEHIAISVEDFLRLVSCYFVNSVDEEDFATESTESLDSVLSDPEVPERLLFALYHILGSETEYATADSEDGGYSILSFDYNSSYSSFPPPVPILPPPTINSQSTQSISDQKCRPNCLIFFSIFFLILIILSVVLSIFVIVPLFEHTKNDNDFGNTISLRFINKSESVSIFNPMRVRVEYDYVNNLATVTSVNTAIISNAKGCTWNGTVTSCFNFSLSYPYQNCAVYGYFNNERIFSCCDPSKQFYSAPDNSGTFRNYTSDLSYIFRRLGDFRYIDYKPTFAYMEQYYFESNNDTYFSLTFHPNDVRYLQHHEIYDFSENVGQWRFLATPQIRPTPDRSVEMILEIFDNANFSRKYVICKYLIGDVNGTLHRNGCIELQSLAGFMDSSGTNAANFHMIMHKNRRLYMVALFVELPSSATEFSEIVLNEETKSVTYGQMPLIVYNMDGQVMDSTTYQFKPDEIKSEYQQLGGPLITDYNLFLFVVNQNNDGYLLQYEFDCQSVPNVNP